MLSAFQITRRLIAVAMLVLIMPVGIVHASDSIGVYDPVQGRFYLRDSLSPYGEIRQAAFGSTATAWQPLIGDWDGDGSETIGLFDPVRGLFRLKNNNARGTAEERFKTAPIGTNVQPLVGDWDGNGTSTVGTYRPDTGVFFIRNQNRGGAPDLKFRFGARNLIALVGDWDGDGADGIGVYNPLKATFFLRNELAAGKADIGFKFGPRGRGWLPVAGDWDDDGKDTVGLYDPATGRFYLKNRNNRSGADLTRKFTPAGVTGIPVSGTWQGKPEITTVARINAGGPAITDRLARRWSADTGVIRGNISVNKKNFSGTPSVELYRSIRWGRNVVASLKVANGDYLVTLHFAENSKKKFGVGLRVFDILAEGRLALGGFDVYAKAGPRAAITRVIPVTVEDGRLDIRLRGQTGNPTLAALQIVQRSPRTEDKSESAPVAANDKGSVLAGSSVAIDVLGNDHVSDGGLRAATVRIVVSPSHGDTTIDALTGVLTYTHDGSASSSDSLSYTVDSSAGATSNRATVAIEIIAPPNADPIARTDRASVDNGELVTVAVLANDSDSDGKLVPATLRIASTPVHGTAVVDTATGRIRYRHDGSATTSDSFTYVVEDDDGAVSNQASVLISVTPAPPPPPGSTTRTLLWDPSSGGVESYRVYYGAQPGSTVVVITNVSVDSPGFDPAAPAVSFDTSADLGLSTGDTACFRVQALNAFGGSGLSDAVCTRI